MVNALYRDGWILKHHRFFDHAGVDWKREWRHCRQLAKAPIEVVTAGQEIVRPLRIKERVAGLAISFFQQRMFRLMLFQHAKQYFRTPVQLLSFPVLTWIFPWHH